MEQPSKTTKQPQQSQTKSAIDINAEIIKQGEIVRNLKAQKAPKDQIDPAVKILLSLKADYKNLTNTEWKPGCVPPTNATAVSDTSDLNAKISAQGDKVRKLKSEKAEKSLVDAEVKILLALKQEYKQKFGKDWVAGAPTPTPVKADSGDCDLNGKITAQGEKVRKLKAEKADKSVIDAEVKVLLALKQEFKQKFGKDWTPGSVPAKPVQNSSSNKSESELLDLIAKQGDLVRKLKGEKAPKTDIDREVKVLLSLKEDFKKVTGKDWKPNMKPEVPNISVSDAGGDSSSSKDVLVAKVTEQGNIVRDLKAKKASKVI